MTGDQRRDIIKLLMELAKADGVIQNQEKEFILDACNNLGIDINEIKENDKEIKFPKTEQERMTVLYYLLFMMNSDGKITNEEEIFIKKIGFKLGFRARLIEDMLDTIAQYPDKSIPPNALVENIKKYLN